MTPIRALQTRLATLGLYTGAVDDDWGPASAAAYIKALAANSLTPSDPDVVAMRVCVASRIPARSRVEAVYGLLEVKDDPARKGKCILVNTEWLDNLKYYEIPLVLGAGKKVKRQIHKRAAGVILSALAEVQYRRDHNPDDLWRPSVFQVYPGFPRHVCWNPAKGLSRHSWACAFDIDPARNPMGADLPYDIPNWVFVILRAWGLTCGVDWQGDQCDPMHVEATR